MQARDRPLPTVRTSTQTDWVAENKTRRGYAVARSVKELMKGGVRTWGGSIARVVRAGLLRCVHRRMGFSGKLKAARTREW